MLWRYKPLRIAEVLLGRPQFGCKVPGRFEFDAADCAGSGGAIPVL